MSAQDVRPAMGSSIFKGVRPKVARPPLLRPKVAVLLRPKVAVLLRPEVAVSLTAPEGSSCATLLTKSNY